VRVAVCADPISYAASLLLRLLSAHPADPVALLDGSNRFDPYALARAARGDPRALLARVRVSRAFTCFQMEALAAQPPPAPRAAVLSLLEPFLEEEVPIAVARELLRRTVASLARRRRVVCVERPPAAPRARALWPILAARAEIRNLEFPCPLDFGI
jgi:hypothetical protein